MIMPCGLSIIKEVLSEGPSGRRIRVGEGESRRRGESEKGRVGEGESGGWEKSSFFLLPSSLFLTSVTSVTSLERIRCRTSFLIKLKSQSDLAKPKPKLQPNCKQPQSAPLRY